MTISILLLKLVQFGIRVLNYNFIYSSFRNIRITTQLLMFVLECVLIISETTLIHPRNYCYLRRKLRLCMRKTPPIFLRQFGKLNLLLTEQERRGESPYFRIKGNKVQGYEPFVFCTVSDLETAVYTDYELVGQERKFIFHALTLCFNQTKLWVYFKEARSTSIALCVIVVNTVNFMFVSKNN